MAGELTDNEILSALNKMDAEQKFFEQMNVARKHIRAVIERYQEIHKALPDLVTEKAYLERTIAGLKDDLESRRRQGEQDISASHARLTADLEARVEPLQCCVNEASTKAEEAKAALDAHEQLAASRIAELDSNIREKERALATLTASFEAFKKQHGLA